LRRDRIQGSGTSLLIWPAPSSKHPESLDPDPSYRGCSSRKYVPFLAS
jgi:hypothetical protein